VGSASGTVASPEKRRGGVIGYCLGARPRCGLSRRRPPRRFSRSKRAETYRPAQGPPTTA